jgi:hypothetical protein
MASLLPPELVELQIAQIDLLLAMYPEEESISLDEETSQRIEALRERCYASDLRSSATSDMMSPLLLDLKVFEPKEYELSLNFPISYVGTDDPIEAPTPTVRLKQPPWMSKADVLAVNSGLSSAVELDLFASIDFVREAVTEHMERSIDEVTQALASSRNIDPLVRVWFYFPSISTRSKRDDLINHAPRYSLTGFLLAGKPGILCLEGASQSIDDYMKFIKTESWGDIPAHHKKVSERYREMGVERGFERMREVTDEVGERRGERANRTDMKALEGWLAARGFGDVMRKIVI